MRRLAIERADSATVEISDEILTELESLPAKRIGLPPHEWTEEEDRVLLEYWPTKRQIDVARILGISTTTCRNRWRELTKK